MDKKIDGLKALDRIVEGIEKAEEESITRALAEDAAEYNEHSEWMHENRPHMVYESTKSVLRLRIKTVEDYKKICEKNNYNPIVVALGIGEHDQDLEDRDLWLSIPEERRHNKEFVKSLLECSTGLYKYVVEDGVFKDDEELFVVATNKHCLTERDGKSTVTDLMMEKEYSSKIRSKFMDNEDTDFAYEIFRKNPGVYRFLPLSLKTNDLIIKEAIKNDPYVVAYEIPEAHLIDTVKYLEIAYKQNPLVLSSFHSQYTYGSQGRLGANQWTFFDLRPEAQQFKEKYKKFVDSAEFSLEDLKVVSDSILSLRYPTLEEIDKLPDVCFLHKSFRESIKNSAMQVRDELSSEERKLQGALYSMAVEKKKDEILEAKYQDALARRAGETV